MLKKIIGIICCAFPLALSAQTGDWKLVWQDEFEYTGLPDPKVWGYEYGQSIRNKESQFYTRSRIENTRVGGGTLQIIARKEPYNGKKDNYTSGSVITKGTKEFLYGRVEVSARLPYGRGIWPAIWMLPAEDYYGGWPHSGEIDIMEYVGFDPSKIHINIHNDTYNNSKKGSKGIWYEVSNLHNKYHLYAMEWSPEKIDFFIDEVKVFTFAKEADNFSVWPFDRPFYLILNVAVGGGWGGQQGIDDSIFPQVMEVDYVRVYQKNK